VSEGRAFKFFVKRDFLASFSLTEESTLYGFRNGPCASPCLVLDSSHVVLRGFFRDLARSSLLLVARYLMSDSR